MMNDDRNGGAGVGPSAPGPSDGTCAGPGLSPASALSATMTERVALIRQAFRLEWTTVAWELVEAGVGISAAIAAGSVTLMAFGIDTLIELASASVLIWRLTVELRRGETFSERAEQVASRLSGGLLFALAVYIVAAAGWSLWTHHHEATSFAGLAIAILAMPIMTVLARRKIAVATKLGSRAMRADAMESITCGWLSLVVVVGLVANLALGMWWVDAATALVIVGLVVREAHEAWRGDECCDDG